MLSPIFEDSAKKIKEKFPVSKITFINTTYTYAYIYVCINIDVNLQEEGRVVLAKVDCDKES